MRPRTLKENGKLARECIACGRKTRRRYLPGPSRHKHAHGWWLYRCEHCRALLLEALDDSIVRMIGRAEFRFNELLGKVRRDFGHVTERQVHRRLLVLQRIRLLRIAGKVTWRRYSLDQDRCRKLRVSW